MKFSDYRQPHPWRKKNPAGPKPGLQPGVQPATKPAIQRAGGRAPWMDTIERQFGPMDGGPQRGGAQGQGIGRIRKNSEDTRLDLGQARGRPPGPGGGRPSIAPQGVGPGAGPGGGRPRPGGGRPSIGPQGVGPGAGPGGGRPRPRFDRPSIGPQGGGPGAGPGEPRPRPRRKPEMSLNLLNPPGWRSGR